MHAIEVKDLCKTFSSGHWWSRKRKHVVALDRISLFVRRGEIFGLLGPNGAGKTTLIRILATLVLPDSGDAWVNGYHVVREEAMVRRSIGVMSGDVRSVYWKLTGRENLLFFGRLYGLTGQALRNRVNQLLQFFELEEWADQPVEDYSSGMKHKIGLARALIHDPPILLLDEPTIGLDPAMANAVRQLICRLRERGKTILLTTHYMEEAELLCDRIALIDRGRIVAEGSPDELKAKLGRARVVVLRLDRDPGRLEVEAAERVEVRSLKEGGVEVRITTYDDASATFEAIEKLRQRGVRVRALSVEAPSLDDVFMHFTGRRIREG